MSMFSSFPNWRLFTVSLSPSFRLQGTRLHSHSFWGKLSEKQMPLQTLFVLGNFWFTDCFCVNHPVTSHSHQIDQQIGLLLMGTFHPVLILQIKKWGLREGVICCDSTHGSGGAVDQSRFEMAEQSVCFFCHCLCGGPVPAQLTWVVLHIPACILASASNG